MHGWCRQQFLADLQRQRRSTNAAAEGVTDIRRYVSEEPGAFEEVAGLTWVLDVNGAGVEFVGVGSRESALGALNVGRLSDGYTQAFLAQLEAIWDRRNVAVAELSGTRPDGTGVEGEMSTFAPTVYRRWLLAVK